MIRLRVKTAVAAAMINFTAITLAFSFSLQSVIRPLELQLNCKVNGNRDIDAANDDPSFVSSRKEFMSNIIAATSSAAPIVFSASRASATTNEPTTRIELTVDTEYLIRVLEYFDGDMRKVLGVLVRTPQTTVEIEPPAKGNDPNLSPKDAILRALYSYKAPEDYVTQASWLKLDEPKKGWVEFLTKKRYKIYLPAIGTDDNKENGVLEVIIQSTNLNLSNLEAGVCVVALSYPIAYSYYNYESFIEEKEKAMKKAQLAAKNAAKGGAAKKDKKSTNRDDSVKYSDNGENRSPEGKDEVSKYVARSIEQLPTNKRGIPASAVVIDGDTAGLKQQKEPKSKSSTTAKIENKELQYPDAQNYDTIVEQQLIQSKSDPGKGFNELEQLVSAAAAENQFKEVEELANIAEQQWLQSEAENDQGIDELEQLVAAAAAAATTTLSANIPAQSTPSSGGRVTSQQNVGANEYYSLDDSTLDFSETDASGTGDMGTNSLRSLVENLKPRRAGPLSNNYLDSL
jgi:hypothetical protein